MLFASSFAPPPPQPRGLLLPAAALLRASSCVLALAQLLRNSCATLALAQLLRNTRATLAQLSRNSRATLAQLLLSCFIGSASARAAQIPSICPPRHLLSSQPQLRLGMSSPVTAARLRSCLPPSADAARPDFMRCGRLALARGHSGEPQDREDPGLLLRFVPEFGRSLELVRAGGLFEPFPFLPAFLPAKKVGRPFPLLPAKIFRAGTGTGAHR